MLPNNDEALEPSVTPSSLEEATEGVALEVDVENRSQSQTTGSIEEPRTFAAILEGLRSAEDTFYFIVEEGSQAGARLPVDSSDLMIGWDESGRNLSTDSAKISTPAAHIRKDWSGVMVQPEHGTNLEVNGQVPGTPQRLRNGDQLLLRYPGGAANPERAGVSLVFHEPASLIVLDSLLPSKLPPPIAKAIQTQMPPEPAAEGLTAMPAAAQARTYFGYFSIVEVLLMAAATILMAAAIFFVLDNT
jgi:hypothetical protein